MLIIDAKNKIDELLSIVKIPNNHIQFNIKLIDILQLYIKSIISGELLIEQNDYQEVINNNDKAIENIIVGGGYEDEGSVQNNLLVLRKFNESYSKFLYRLADSNQFIINIDDNTNEFIAVQEEDASSKYFITFKIAQEILWIDIINNFRSREQDKLIKLYKELNKIVLNPEHSYLIKILKDKVVYLLHIANSKEDRTEQLIFSADNKRTSLEEMIDNSPEYIKGIVQRLEGYKKTKKKLNYTDTEEFSNSYNKIRQYRANKNIASLKELLADYKKEYKMSEHNYSSSKFICTRQRLLAIKHRIVFLQNTILSVMIDLKKSFSEIDEQYNRVIHDMNNYGIRNFYPHKKMMLYIDSISDKIDTHSFNNNSTYIDLDGKYKKSFEWCKNNNFIPFILPYKESQFIDSSNEEEVKVLIATSIIEPVNYIDEEIEMYKYRGKYYDSKVRIIFKDTKYELDSKIKDNEKKSVEIISIFAAIVLFVSSSIQIFSNNLNIKYALALMLMFGFTLSLFIFILITLLNEPESKFWGIKTKLWFLIYLLVGLFTSLIYIYLA